MVRYAAESTHDFSTCTLQSVQYLCAVGNAQRSEGALNGTMVQARIPTAGAHPDSTAPHGLVIQGINRISVVDD